MTNLTKVRIKTINPYDEPDSGFDYDIDWSVALKRLTQHINDEVDWNADPFVDDVDVGHIDGLVYELCDHGDDKATSAKVAQDIIDRLNNNESISEMGEEEMIVVVPIMCE